MYAAFEGRRHADQRAFQFLRAGACLTLVLLLCIGRAASASAPLIGAESVSAGGFHACAIVDGAALCWGFNSNGQLGDDNYADSSVPTPVVGLSSGVTSIAAGGLHTCAVVNGGVKCWGRNPD